MSAPRVDFYILAGGGDDARHRFACRLTEKAYRLQHRVHLHVDDPAAGEMLDDLLWTFRDGSFVPHESLPAKTGAPVTIGHGASIPEAAELLINLSRSIPDFVGNFERVAELVGADETSRQEGRKRFIFYREKGYPLETHEIGR